MRVTARQLDALASLSSGSHLALWVSFPKRLCGKVVSLRSERDLTGYASLLLSALVKRSQTTLHTASNTTVPLKRFKPKTGTQAQLEARPARSAPTSPLYTSVGTGWRPSTTVRSAQAIHERHELVRTTHSIPSTIRR